MQLSEASRIVELLLKDIPNSRQYESLASDLMDNIQKYQEEQYIEWKAEIENTMNNPHSDAFLRKSGQLMELDFEKGTLSVNYGEKLVSLLREVRQLLALGLQVPVKVQTLADQAQKFYRHGIVLKQVAHFYNTIDQQMLPCQQAMLLDAALAFEKLVKNPKDEKNCEAGKSGKVVITWDNPAEVEKYIQKLQTSAEKLTGQNRKFRKMHAQITDTVVTLMNVDLIRHSQRWKDKVQEIRSSISGVQEQGVKMEDTLSWRIHWDYQLYKALEHQYQVGLETMNEALPEIKVDLIFKSGKLQFRPPLEEVRAKYFRDMKKFINTPVAFTGVGEGRVFNAMVDMNAPSLATVYKKSEILFTEVLRVVDQFKEWVILGTIDLEEFVDSALGDVSDWEFNFKMVKQKGKEAEQLPIQRKVDCITVSLLPVKATIDDHLQRLSDALQSSLKKTIGIHFAAIEEFVIKGMELLSKKPQTIEEIGNAHAIHQNLLKNKTSVQHHFDSAESKNKLLKSVIGAGVDMSGIQTRWSKLELMLESHDLMIKEQVEALKSGIDIRKQKFLKDLEKFSSRWYQLKPKLVDLSDKDSANKAVSFVKNRKVEFSELYQVYTSIVENCAHFQLPVPEFEDLQVVKSDLEKSESMWGYYESYTEDLQNYYAEDWISFRSKAHVFEDFIGKWSEALRNREPDAITVHIQREMDGFREVFPCLKFLRGESWMPEHWGELFRTISMPREVTVYSLTFGHFLHATAAVLQNLDAIKEINNRANGEIQIREAIQELDIWGSAAVFTTTNYQDNKGESICLIKDWKETLTQLGDHQSLLQSLKESPYYKNFMDKVALWEQKLTDLDEYLHNLNLIQRKWVYLEPIFSRGALPSEQHRFARIDEDFRSIMTSVLRDNRILSILSYPSLRETLRALVDQLERCQKALNEFLEEKREKFARFYFIGDEDLLEILGQSQNPNVIQAHLKKLFAGVYNVVLDDSSTLIVAMRSIEGEHVPLRQPVALSAEVESWLHNFANEMKATLQQQLIDCSKTFDVFKYPQQILGLAEAVHFTSKCESSIANGSLVNLSVVLEKELETYTSFNIDSINDETERQVMELKVKSLILDKIHFIDVVEQLKRKNVSTISDWEWQRQLRFYISPKDSSCVMRMSDAEFMYTYEYQGNPSKLVHTPLTDKCYLTLTQAMASGFGGNPFGPAGTGKTESVKALGSLFGRQVLVFNCDEGIDYKSMGRIFTGIVKCGAWGCFDEFNRLEEAVLSAVSQQIQVIQAALKCGDKSVSLIGKTTDLDGDSAIFVTLNPAGKGYGGRQKLPDNLKQLFRSVAMTHPDLDLIADTILCAEGFKCGKDLGMKVVAIFSLCKQLLSTQQHYDWGLRAIKAVLRLSGNLLRRERSITAVSAAKEASIILKALRVNTLSKLTFEDCQRFINLMNDVFPDVAVESINYEALGEAIRESYDDLHLVYMENQVEKVLQFYEACNQRMGVVIVGPSGSGKSTLWKVLKLALSKMCRKLMVYTMNPKAVNKQQLLGHMDMDTREWSDGILTAAARQTIKESSDTQSWIICDGDIDPEWVESLNSVLDDNRLLTIPNGERIQFGPNVNFIFETRNLTYASPATVS